MTSPGPATLIWLLMLGIAVVGANSLALSPILSDVAADLGATPVQVARANAAYGGATALSALALGRCIDRFGPGRVLVGGLAALACAMLASAAATDWIILALAQAVAGVAAGLVLPATYALATVLAPPGRSAETLGRVLTGWSVALVLGVPLSAMIASISSWRVSYLALACVLALASALLVRSAAGAAVTRSDATMRDALRRPAVLPLLLVCFLFMTAFYGVYAYLGDHVRGLLGLSAAQAGLIVLAYGAGFGAASLGDRAIDRIGIGRLFAWVLLGITLVYAAMIQGVGTYAIILVLAAAWGFGNHFGLNILVLRLTQSAPDGRGAVLALNSAVSYLGALAGAVVMGVLYERFGFASVAGAAGACTGLAALVALGLAPSSRAATVPE